MKKMFRKVLTMAMATMMAVGVTATPAFAADEIKVHVKVDNVANLDNTDDLSMYTYNAELLGTWPGTKMTKEADGWYTATVSEVPEGIIFNNTAQTGEKNVTQTDDIKDNQAGEYWYVVTGNWEYQKYDNAADAGYTLAEDATAGDTTTGSEGTTSPQTGDNAAYIILAAALLIVTGTTAVVIKKRQTV